MHKEKWIRRPLSKVAKAVHLFGGALTVCSTGNQSICLWATNFNTILSLIAHSKHFYSVNLRNEFICFVLPLLLLLITHTHILTFTHTFDVAINNSSFPLCLFMCTCVLLAECVWFVNCIFFSVSYAHTCCCCCGYSSSTIVQSSNQLYYRFYLLFLKWLFCFLQFIDLSVSLSLSHMLRSLVRFLSYILYIY